MANPTVCTLLYASRGDVHIALPSTKPETIIEAKEAITKTGGEWTFAEATISVPSHVFKMMRAVFAHDMGHLIADAVAEKQQAAVEAPSADVIDEVVDAEFEAGFSELMAELMAEGDGPDADSNPDAV